MLEAARQMSRYTDRHIFRNIEGLAAMCQALISGYTITEYRLDIRT